VSARGIALTCHDGGLRAARERSAGSAADVQGHAAATESKSVGVRDEMKHGNDGDELGDEGKARSSLPKAGN